MGQSRLAPDPKEAEADRAHLVLIDETGLLLNPLVRRTWAPRGKTPVIPGDGGHRRKVSVIGAVTVSPAGRRPGLYFAALPDGYFDAGAVVGSLRGLLRHLRGKVVVVWGGGGDHKGPAVRALPRRNRRLTLERPPAYAPALNPAERVWSWLKYGRLANYVPDGAAELDDEVVERLAESECDPGRLRGLWAGSDLPFPGRPDGQPCLPADQ